MQPSASLPHLADRARHGGLKRIRTLIAILPADGLVGTGRRLTRLPANRPGAFHGRGNEREGHGHLISAGWQDQPFGHAWPVRISIETATWRILPMAHALHRSSRDGHRCRTTRRHGAGACAPAPHCLRARAGRGLGPAPGLLPTQRA